MEPFRCRRAEVVRAVAATLDDYAILPTSPEERERSTGLPKDYDIRGVLVLRGASRPFGRAGGRALSACAGAYADGRGSRGACFCCGTVRLLDSFHFPI